MATLAEIAEIHTADREAEETRRRGDKERARIRKQQQRERNREKARLKAVAEAERMEQEAARREINDEHLAPAVLRQPIFAPNGQMIVGPRVQIVEGRAIRGFGIVGNPAANMRLSGRQKRAADLLQADWRDVGAGLGVGAMDYLRSGGGAAGAAPAGHDAMLGQIEARARLDGALTHLGAFTPAVVRVVLDCVPVAVWGHEAGKTTDEARGWIVAALERLSGFYWPPKPEGVSGPVLLTFGPRREDYDTGVDENS